MHRPFVSFVTTGFLYFFSILVASSAVADDRPLIVNGPSDRIAKFSRPTLNDFKLIKIIAEIGAPQTVTFPAGANVSRFIADKCGQPSAGMLIHPIYEQILIDRNKSLGLKHDNLVKFSRPATLEIPACAMFANKAGNVPVFGEPFSGVVNGLSIPFNSSAFAKAVTDTRYRNALQTEYLSVTSGNATNKFEKVVAQFCDRTMKIGKYDDSYLSCASSAEIAAANPQITNPNRVSGQIRVPVVAKLNWPEKVGNDYVPLNPEYKAIFANLNVSALTPEQLTTEPTLKFVTEMNNPEQFGPACANAEAIRVGAWPFNVVEFERVLKLSGITSNNGGNRSGKILIVDSGFDFAEGGSADVQVMKAFPVRYFHQLPRDEDPPERGDDQNHDGVIGNGGWAGVNLAAVNGSPSAATSVIYDHRSHGIAVTTLALGGRGTEDLRQRMPLPIEIGEASLVPLNTKNPILNSGHVEKSITFAHAEGNQFNVINFSLSSIERIATLDKLVGDTEKRLLVVVAAGNDGQELNSKKGVWPAALGGFAAASDSSTSAFITVGAHDGDGNYVKFSNYGAGVDILAPGCTVPSYELKLDNDKNAIGITEKSMTGTSIAAPLVSFVAGILVSDPQFGQKPGLIKNRIQAASDYDYALQERAVSSGKLDVAKVIGFKYDILELDDTDTPPMANQQTGDGMPHKLRFGTATLKSNTARFKCGFDPPIPFASIRKIARDKIATDPVLVMSTEDPTKPAKLNIHFCPPNSLDVLEYDFYDVESKDKITYKAADVWDFVAKQ